MMMRMVMVMMMHTSYLLALIGALYMMMNRSTAANHFLKFLTFMPVYSFSFHRAIRVAPKLLMLINWMMLIDAG